MQAVVALQLQYRMCDDIMTLSNALVYDGRLRCASDAVACARLAVPGYAALAAEAPPWLAAALDPARAVVFLDTDAVPAVEARVGDSTTNPGEARLVLRVVAALCAAGVPGAMRGAVLMLQPPTWAS